MPYKDKQKEKECQKKYRETHKQKTREYNREYCQKPKRKEYLTKYFQKPEVKIKRNKHKKNFYKKNRDKILKWMKEHHQKPETKAKIRKYYQENRDKILEFRKEYNQKPEVKARRKEYKKKYSQRPEVKERLREYFYEKIKSDKNYAVGKRLRILLRQALKLYTKTGKIMSSKKYGINYKKIIKQLKPFPKDIENYHIDHIKPLCSFNLTDPEEIKKAFSPENHQWLTIQENLSKAGRY